MKKTFSILLLTSVLGCGLVGCDGGTTAQGILSARDENVYNYGTQTITYAILQSSDTERYSFKDNVTINDIERPAILVGKDISFTTVDSYTINMIVSGDSEYEFGSDTHSISQDFLFKPSAFNGNFSAFAKVTLNQSHVSWNGKYSYSTIGGLTNIAANYKVYGSTFAKTGTLVKDTDYTISNATGGDITVKVEGDIIDVTAIGITAVKDKDPIIHLNASVFEINKKVDIALNGNPLTTYYFVA